MTRFVDLAEVQRRCPHANQSIHLVDVLRGSTRAFTACDDCGKVLHNDAGEEGLGSIEERDKGDDHAD